MDGAVPVIHRLDRHRSNSVLFESFYLFEVSDMLILTRRMGGRLRIGDDVSVTVMGIYGHQVN